MERKAFMLLNETKYWTLTQMAYAFHRYGHGLHQLRPPIFIVGPGHSGTSLILAILGAHSSLYPIPTESNLAYKSPEVQQRLIKRFRKLTVAAGKARWVEKTPRHINKIEELFSLFPDAKIVVTMRDGRDVACSYKARRRSGIEEHIDHWVSVVERARRFVDHPQVRMLRYEDLVVDFDGTIRGLMTFLGEEYEAGQAEYYKEPIRFYWHRVKAPNTPRGGKQEQYSNWQLNQPLFDGRGRWHDELKPQEKLTFKRNAGDLLVDLGYEADHAW